VRPTSALAAVLLAAAAAGGQTLDDLIARGRAFAGGDAKLRGVTSERLSGTYSVRGGPAARLVVEVRRPRKARVEADLARGLFVAGFDGERAWQINPTVSPGRVAGFPPDLARRVAALADIDGPLPSLRGDGAELSVGGRERERGRNVVRVQSGSGAARAVLRFDADDGRLLSWRGRLAPGRSEIEVRFDEYAEAGGIVRPRCVRIGAPGEADRIVVEFTRVEIDPEIEDAAFSPPPAR